jgi:hypothetical protein
MIEDNDEEYVFFDENSTKSVRILQSTLKALIGPYKLFSNDDLNKIEYDIGPTLK